jgi:hypothetical protein
MSCEKCRELMQTVEVRTPQDFQVVLRVVKANVKDQTIEQHVASAARVVPSITIDSLGEGGPWPDVLDEQFRCLTCGQGFRLEAETYHGAGGHWRPS